MLQNALIERVFLLLSKSAPNLLPYANPAAIDPYAFFPGAIL